MPSKQYNADDIPRELLRLIDRTDRGIEQLYQLAGQNAKVTDSIRRGSSRRFSTQRRAQRDAYYYDPTRALRASAHRRHRTSDLDGEGRGRRRGQRGASLESYSDEEDYAEDEEGGSNYSDGEAYEELSNSPGHGMEPGRGGRNGLLDRRQRKTSRAHAPTARPHPSSSSSHSAHHRDDLLQRHSPTSTPNRTTHHLSGVSLSSPGSLKKPPYAPQPDLPSPSSFLSSSLPSLSTSAQQLPPWQQRRQAREGNRRGATTARSGLADDDEYGDAPTRNATGSTRLGGSPSSLHDNTAYRTHLAAQQSTQKPHPATDAATATRQRPYRSLLFMDSDGHASAAATPDALRAIQGSCARRDNSLEVAPPPHHHNGSNASTASASAGMLSRFGKRWGAVFEEMLIAPPPPAATETVKAANAAVPRRDSTDRRVPSQTSHGSSSATLEGESEEAAVRRKRPLQRETEGSFAAPPTTTSTSLLAAAEALAARPRASLPSSAVPSANTSGVVVRRTSPPPTPHALQSSVDARLVGQLRAETEAKEEAIRQLRVDHAREMAELRQVFALERASATKHTADELATTYGIQQQLLQSSLQTERERVAEAEEKLRMTRREAAQRKLDLEDATHALETLQSKYKALANAQQELMAQSAQWRGQAEKASATARQLESQEKVWRAKEVDWQARENQLLQRVQAAEERLRLQETSAQEVLAQLEAEFAQTSESYHDLLAEATKRMSYLEKSHRKYKVLKESHSLLKAEHAQLVESTVQRTQRHENEVSTMHAEVQELRRQLHQRDSASQEASESYQETLNDYKRRLELQEANAAERVQTLQQHVETANHTIELLRSQLESARQEMLEEQGRSQQQQMEAAQAELRAKENLAEQQRSAAAYKVRTEDVIANQKRQLREKDAKMQALAAGAAEPIQRLREQLEDERGRRARLEEQLKTYKRKAKEAEEHATAEIRREQLRNALLSTPATSASASAPQRLLRSATATPLMHSASTPRPFFAGVGSSISGRGEAATTVSVDAAGRRTISALSSAGGTVGGGMHRGTAPSHAAPPPVAAIRGTTPPGEGARTWAAKEQRQMQRRGPPHTPTSPPAADAYPLSHRHAPPGGSKADDAPKTPHVSGVTHVAGGTAADRPCAPALNSAQPTALNERRRSSKDEVVVSAAAAGVVGTPVVSANATVQSLSGISHSSPYTSTLLGEAEFERAAAIAAPSGTAAGLRSGRNSSKQCEIREASESSEEEKDGASSTVPWYARTARRRNRAKDEEEPRLPACEAPAFSLPAAASHEDAVAAATTTQVYTDTGVQEHEERMKTFHASALEVMRRFAGSRQEALARCADIVKQTVAERRREAQARRQYKSVSDTSPADAAVYTDASESESEF
ncbi:hypothetical protein ABL78_5992 [Leptomonas seymouri]|uniref:Uncharacterized protein n=1 Tax=Leptomonas seymouri TaxID=5684 RepID=A0A0N0P469_LEPSE|nr:hypothetical protein ABL78_5992 [Leptomonas seymouri]|eukprot:KPI84949.1 hypothetical protein ABL78_5992 [Leptomonas seymouri]